jgi:hypothetical protein
MLWLSNGDADASASATAVFSVLLPVISIVSAPLLGYVLDCR